MGVKAILDFVKIEHTLFSLPFVFIGALLAGTPTALQITWILIAAVGARGLAMALNRIIDREIDARNPRTEGRHLASGSMSLGTAWGLAALFLAMLGIGAWQLHPICLWLAPVPVFTFVVYPYLKRFTWACHFWLGLCLALAPAGAWLAIQAPLLGWAAITEMHWWPTLFWVCFGVLLWIAAFDLNYALMDVDSDRAQGIHSFPAKYGPKATVRTSAQLTLAWFACFMLADPVDAFTFASATILTAGANLFVIVRMQDRDDFQTIFFRSSVITGWVLLAGLVFA